MIHKLGDKELVAQHIVAIGQPEHYEGIFLVRVYNSIGHVACEFKIQDGEEFSETNGQKYRWGLVLKDGSIDWNEHDAYYRFKESLIYERMTNEIKNLKEEIEKN